MHLLSAGASTPFLAEGGVRRATLVPYFIGVNCNVSTSKGCNMTVTG